MPAKPFLLLLCGALLPAVAYAQLGYWSSAGGMVRAHMGFYVNGPRDPEEGPAPRHSWGLNGWEVEARPFPIWAVKLERTRNASYSDIGIIFLPRANRDKLDGRFEVNLGHTAVGRSLFGSGRSDDGTRWLVGLSASAGI